MKDLINKIISVAIILGGLFLFYEFCGFITNVLRNGN
jgi:hypothetical protein